MPSDTAPDAQRLLRERSIKKRKWIERLEERWQKRRHFPGSSLETRAHRQGSAWAGETEAASPSRELKLRLFCVNFLASGGHSSLPLSLSSCLHLLLGDQGKPARARERKPRFRRTHSFFKEHFRGKRGPWFSDAFHRLCEHYQERASFFAFM